MDHHTVAAVSITGSCLDVLGTLYLAYDLLGGQHGPLRLLTRAVTYSIVFGIGYGIGLGLFFGLASGAATGITIAVELRRTAHSGDHYSLPWEALFSAIRGFAFGAGLYWMLGLRFAIAFGVIITVGQIFAYARGIRPGMDYAASRRPRLTQGSSGLVLSERSDMWRRRSCAARWFGMLATSGHLRFELGW
ncbi:MAG: hypothetical protein ACR2JB_15625 [Bryobacteraceae bacterium]